MMRLHLISAVMALTCPLPVFATVGCEVVSDTGTQTVPLFYGPGADAVLVLRQIPVGDIVRLLNDDLAPSTSDGWVWVHHEITQSRIWQGGITGWVKDSQIADCG